MSIKIKKAHRQLVFGDFFHKLHKIVEREHEENRFNSYIYIDVYGEKMDIVHPPFISWRGCYRHVSLDNIEQDKSSTYPLMSVTDLCEDAIYECGKIMKGYRGGSYRLRLDTPVWAAPLSSSDPIAVIDSGAAHTGVSSLNL